MAYRQRHCAPLLSDDSYHFNKILRGHNDEVLVEVSYRPDRADG